MTKEPCQKCQGEGAYLYDENHGKFCELCCDHPVKGWYKQTEFHPNPEQLTCSRCGGEVKQG